MGAPKVSLQTTNERALPALVLCSLWVLGFEAAPLVHQLDHDRAHDGAHDHAHDRTHDHAHEGDAPAAPHGEHSLQHRDLAAQVPLPALPPIAPASRERLGAPERAAERMALACAHTPRARGPPS